MLLFGVLGPLTVTRGGEPVRIGGPRPRALLATLLAHAGRPVTAGHLIGEIWGSEPPATASTALQVHVSALRKVLGDCLKTTISGYQLEVAPTSVDAASFAAQVAAARQDVATRPASAATALAAALALWRGEPYSEVDGGPDVEAERIRLAGLRLSATEDWAEAELALGRHAAVAAELPGLAGQYPERERLTRLVMLALHRSGRPAEALALAGGDHRPGIAELAAAIERRDPTLDPPAAVPAPASRFVGRRAELEAMAGRLGVARLLTVTGPGGVGKTRLALELARDTATSHPDGVTVAELASTRPGEVASRVASALAARPRPGQSVLDCVAAELYAARALLILDNCEHVIGEAAGLAAWLLARCTGLRVLATSREPLGVDGEVVWPLAGLAVPGPGDPAGLAITSEAVRLLADRGAAARRGFTVDGGNLPAAVHLCQRLDGLPLAIELAAAQLRTRSLTQIATGLDERLDMSDVRSRTTPGRHRTMRAAIGWSFGLLTPQERTAMARLAVFAGGFTAEAAREVAGLEHPVLERLTDQSMLTVSFLADGPRFGMLELIREYAAEPAGAAHQDGRRERHARWCAELAEEAARSSSDGARLRQLRAELPNLRAAMAWALGPGGDLAVALRISASLWWFWGDHGLGTEALGWLQQATASHAAVPAELRARALRAAASLSRPAGDLGRSRELGERSAAAYRDLGEPLALAGALNGVAWTALAQRDYPAALAYAEECRQITEAAGDEFRSAATLNPLGLALIGLGRPAEAATQLAGARRRLAAIAEPGAEAAAASNLAMVTRILGDRPAARALYRESLKLFTELGLVPGQLEVLEGLAGLEAEDGEPATALRVLEVTSRAWLRHDLTAVSPVRQDDRAATRAAALAALGSRSAQVVAEARQLDLSTVVTGYLP
ncbi:AfsR/SARP family transcriptional regulator [Longispora albida]|uniref:AfsR/SARP family transcriptional regulator n=1 Tax=Longispora albida TaxID=203523 RepID=UPI00036C9EDF|nr:BTAD domain-containing putative transcriptional regulator [Longispora albida]